MTAFLKYAGLGFWGPSPSIKENTLRCFCRGGTAKLIIPRIKNRCRDPPQNNCEACTPPLVVRSVTRFIEFVDYKTLIKKFPFSNTFFVLRQFFILAFF